MPFLPAPLSVARQGSHRASRLNHSLCFIPSSALFANLSCRKVVQVHIMSPPDKLLEKSQTSKIRNSIGELYVVKKSALLKSNLSRENSDEVSNHRRRARHTA